VGLDRDRACNRDRSGAIEQCGSESAGRPVAAISNDHGFRAPISRGYLECRPLTGSARRRTPRSLASADPTTARDRLRHILCGHLSGPHTFCLHRQPPTRDDARRTQPNRDGPVGVAAASFSFRMLVRPKFSIRMCPLPPHRLSPQEPQRGQGDGWHEPSETNAEIEASAHLSRPRSAGAGGVAQPL